MFSSWSKAIRRSAKTRAASGSDEEWALALPQSALTS